MVTIDGKTYFGNEGCTPIEVEPFEPLCSHDPVAGTDPLLLDVPVPSFVPAVPPNECACFTFIKAELDKDKQVDPQHKLVVDGRASDAKFAVEILPDPNDCCTGKYTIAPNVQIPCLPFEIGEAVVEQSTTNGTGSIDFRLEADACTLVPHINIQFPQPGGLVPCTTELKTTPIPDGGTPRTFGFKVVYKSKNNVDPAEKNVEFSLSRNPENGDCPVYTLKSGGPLDLTDLATGSVSNGGGVNLRDGDDTLWLNGEPNGGETWYGGSLGNSNSVDGYAPIFRGTVRRNGNGPGWGADLPIPYVTWNQHQLIDDENRGHTKWTSRRLAADGKTFSGDDVNLNMLVPTGFQWHDRGVACAMSRYIYAPSGLLASLEEDTSSPILAPGLACWADGAGLKPTVNVSGLSIHAGGAGDPSRASAGLRINYGDGLRIYGDGEPTTAASDRDESRQGCLEVMYGYGFRIQDYTVEGGFLTKPVSASGALSLHFGGGLKLHGVETRPDLAPGSVGALEINVKKGGGLKVNENGELEVNDGELAKKDHSHGLIDKDGYLDTEHGSADKVVVTDANKKITWDTDLAASKLRALQAAGNYETAAGSTDKYVRGLTLNINSGAPGITLNCANAGHVDILFGDGSEKIYAKTGTSSGLVLHSSTSLELEGSIISLSATDSGKVELNAPTGSTVLTNPPNYTAESAKGSKAVATCGWVADNFGPLTLDPNLWVKTDAAGKLTTTDEVPAVLAKDEVPSADDPSDAANGGLVGESDKAARADHVHPWQGGKTASTYAIGDHGHGNIDKDGRYSNKDYTPLENGGDILKVESDGTITAGLGISTVTGLSDTEFLAGITGLFVNKASTGSDPDFRLPTTKLTFDSDEEHAGNCLLMIDNGGDVHHSGNDMYDTLAALQGSGSRGPVRYSNTSGVIGFTGFGRDAFGTLTGEATVVFAANEDTASLVAGLPVTIESATLPGTALMRAGDGTSRLVSSGLAAAIGGMGTKGKVLTLTGDGGTTWAYAGTVKTVEGQEPDEDGNVTIIGGGGDAGFAASDTHVHGILGNDGVLRSAPNTAVTYGAILVSGEGGVLSAGLGLHMTIDDQTVIAGVVSSFTYNATTETWKLPTSKLTFDGDSGHQGLCLLQIDGNGNVDHSGNAMYDTLHALASNASSGPVLYNGSGAGASFSGFRKSAFGGAGTRSATVVFQSGENVASLQNGLPATIPDETRTGFALMKAENGSSLTTTGLAAAIGAPAGTVLTADGSGGSSWQDAPGKVKTVDGHSPDNTTGDVKTIGSKTGAGDGMGTWASPNDHTHGNLSRDGKVGTADGRFVTTGAGGAVETQALTGHRGYTDIDVFKALSASISAFTNEGGVAAANFKSSSIYDDECDSGGDCLACFTADKTLAHLGNAKMTVGKLQALDGVLLFDGSGPTGTTYKGLKRDAFNGTGVTGDATVVFNGTDTTASLIPGLPLTEDGDAKIGDIMAMSADAQGNPTLTPAGFTAPTNAYKGAVLVADGAGGATWEEKLVTAGVGLEYNEKEGHKDELQVMYGPGFRICGSQAGAYVDNPKSTPGALVPNEGRGLRVHGVSKMDVPWPGNGQEPPVASRINELEVHKFSLDMAFMADGRLAFNDAMSQGATVNRIPYGSYYRRGSKQEMVIPVLVPYIEDLTFYQYDGTADCSNCYWGGIKNGWDGKNFAVVFLRVSESGLILSATDRPNDTDITRFALH